MSAILSHAKKEASTLLVPLFGDNIKFVNELLERVVLKYFWGVLEVMALDLEFMKRGIHHDEVKAIHLFDLGIKISIEFVEFVDVGLWDGFIIRFLTDHFKKVAGQDIVGSHIHEMVIKSGMSGDLPVNNLILFIYAKCGRLRYVERLVNGMVESERVSWNAIITSDCPGK